MGGLSFNHPFLVQKITEECIRQAHIFTLLGTAVGICKEAFTPSYLGEWY